MDPRQELIALLMADIRYYAEWLALPDIAGDLDHVVQIGPHRYLGATSLSRIGHPLSLSRAMRLNRAQAVVLVARIGPTRAHAMHLKIAMREELHYTRQRLSTVLDNL